MPDLQYKKTTIKNKVYLGLTKVVKPDPITKIFSKTEITDTCWLYKGIIKSGGYGNFIHNGKNHVVHRFVYETFFGPIDKNLFCCHKCDVKNCINPAHIFIGTPKENSTDMKAKGRSSYGEKNGSSKLNEESVRKIRTLRKSGKKLSKIGAMFGVTPQCIYLISNNKKWKHVKE